MVYYRTVAEALQESYPESPYLQSLQAEIARMDARISLTSQITEARHPDIYGKKIRLSSLAGKVVLLDFWSAELGSSNALNADLKELYRKYADAPVGFEVYQVAVDTSKPLWITAVQEQQLPWISVSDLRGHSSVALGLYNVQRLPANFLIDKEGTIVAKNIYGKSLEAARAVERRFVAWLDDAARDAEAIFLVGDIFDFWFEYRRVVPKGFVRTLGKLAELTDRGVRVVFFTGNHDMWVGDYLARECGLEIHTSPEVMTLSGKKVFIAHGDNMKIDGQPMLKFLNRIFRSRTLRWLFSWGVHPDWALRFGHWWSGRSRKGHGEEAARGASLTEPYTGSSEPHTEPLVEYAREYSRTHAVDLFVFGHMHFPRDCREGRLHVVNLGCWAENPSYAVLDAAGELTLKMPGKTSV